MTRYRWVTPSRTGAWHPTKEDAERAAANAGEGHLDDYADKLGRRRFYPSPLTRIESEN